jgi:iron complex outermembrane recepter protein
MTMKINLKQHCLLLCMGAILLTVGRTAIAADPTSTVGELQEVIVTAERRETDLQRTALSVTAISAEQVEKTGISTFENLLQTIPGVQVQALQGPVNTPYIAIRGLGTDGDNKPGATALYLDGIVSGTWGGQLYDLNRVEVLRGPQGTLYGGIATGGALNIVSNNPSMDKFAGNAQVEIGEYQMHHVTGMLNIPLSERTGLRIAANTQSRNSYADSHQDNLTLTNARVKLLAKPNDSVSLLLGAEIYSSSGVGPDGQQAQDANGNLTGPYAVITGNSKSNGYKGYVNLDWDLGAVKFTSISAIQKYDSVINTIDLMGANNVVAPNRDTKTQELRLASDTDSSVSWVSGLWYKDYQQKDTVNIGFAPVLPVGSLVPFPCGPPLTPGGPPQFCPTSTRIISVPESRDDQQFGAFGQVTAAINDKLRVTAGLRLSKDDIHAEQNLTWESFLAPAFCVYTGPPPASCVIPTIFRKTFTNTDYLARVEYQASPGRLNYAMISTGYRPGGAGAPKGAITDPDAVYGKEQVRAYEVGTKNRFRDNRVQLNGALYYNDYPSFQNNLTFWQGNARLTGVVPIAATIYGAELELQALVSQNDQVSASTSYIHATYAANATTRDPFTGAPVSLPTTGKSLPHAPKLQLNVNYDHTFRLGSGGSVVWNAGMHYQDAQLVAFDACIYNRASCDLPAPGASAQPQWNQPSYTLIDTSFSFSDSDKRLTATFYARNLTNEVYKVNNAGNLASLGAPRTVGVVFGLKF